MVKMIIYAPNTGLSYAWKLLGARPRQLAEFLLEMLKPSPKTVVLKEDINALNTMIVELGESGSVVDNYSD